MNKQTLKLLALAASLFAATQAQALEGKWVANIGIDAGGDRLVTVATDKGDRSTRANSGLAMNIGGVFPNNPEKSFETMVTAGYKFGGTFASNGEATWSSVPLELVQFYRANNMRFGLGGTYHVSNKLKLDIPQGGSGTVNFDDAFGVIAQIGYAPAAGIYSVDLRYTDIKYGIAGSKVDGGTVGLYTSVRF